MSHKAHYTSTNEMLSVGLRLLENTTLNAGDTSYPVQFQLPKDALPSYLGNYASVIWKLSAVADIPWRSDLMDQGYLRVLAVHPEQPTPVSVENLEARPKIRLELPSNIYEPGEAIRGKLTLLEPGNLRGVRLQLVQHEDATARGTFGDAHRTADREAGPVVGISLDGFSSGSTTFQLSLPQSAPSSYKGGYSWTAWVVKAVLDIPHGSDINLYAPFLVALRQKPGPPTAAPAAVAPETAHASTTSTQEAPTIIQETSGSMVLEQAQPPAPAETFPSATEDLKSMEARRAIIDILSDGSSKDLLTISSELQEKTQDFLDLDQVRRICEDLLSKGKLTKTAEGEFFAKYRLKTPGYS